MGWRDWFAIKTQPAKVAARPVEAVESRALTEPIYKFTGMRQGIVGTEQQPVAHKLLTDGFASTQATAARAVANRLSDLEFVMQERKRNEEGEIRWVEDDEHKFISILNRPNPLLTRRQMLKLTSYWLSQNGEAFWLAVTNGAGSTREFWPMSPSSIEKLSDETSPVSGFIFHGEAGETRYSLSEVVWIFDPDPADPFAGVGVVGPQANAFDSNTFANQTIRSHYQNDATPKIVLKGGETAVAPTAEAKEAFYADWKNRFNRRGGADRGMPAFIPTDWDAKELLGGSSVGDSVELLKFLQDQFFMANGVPRSVVGDVVDANRAAADTNRLVFDRHTIKPPTGLIAEALTNQIVIPEFGENWRCVFEDFIDEDADLRLKEEEQDLTLKVRSVNQVRSDRGLEPVDWGDAPVGSFGDQPYEPDEFDDDGDPEPIPGNDPDPEPEPDPDPEDESRHYAARAIAPKILAANSPEAAWRRVVQDETRYVPRMVSAMRKVFAGQKYLTLEALANQGGELAVTTGRAYSRVDWIDELFAIDDMSRLFDTLVTPISVEAYERAGENLLLALGQRPTLSFDETAAKQIRENGAQLVTLANATTKRNLRNTLAKGIEAGESFADLEKRVRRVYNAASKSRARTIARTETGHAISKGQLAGLEESSVVALKRWNTALDDRVRDSHEIDGQTVRVAETFTLGDGEQALAPRVAEDGGRLSARNSINCRCFVTPAFEE